MADLKKAAAEVQAERRKVTGPSPAERPMQMRALAASPAPKRDITQIDLEPGESQHIFPGVAYEGVPNWTFLPPAERKELEAASIGNAVGSAAGMFGGELVMPHMMSLPMRLLGAGVVASGANATGAAAEAAAKGQNPLPAAAEAAKYTNIPFTDWRIPTPLLGAGFQLLGEGAGGSAKAIRDSRTTTGENVRLMEQQGARISPLPGPVAENAPSAQFGVEPNSRGRGIVGERTARTLQKELEVQERLNRQRLQNVEKPRALEKQGDRSISVEELLPEIDAAIADPKYKALGLEEKLKSVRAMLAGEMEPTMEIHAARPSKAGGSVGSVEERMESPIEIFTGQPEAVTTSRAPVFVHHGGKVAPRERFATGGLSAIEAEAIPGGPQNTVSGRAVTFDPGEPTVISSVERPGFQSSATSAGGHEPVVVPMGDVRNRVGDAPNRVMSAKVLDRLRQALDEIGDAAAFQIGERDAKKLPLYATSNRVRALVRKEAPAVGLANRRASDRGKKLERTRERMKTDSSESLGMQIASLGEEGSKNAGVREVRMEELRRQFPTSPEMPRERVDRLMAAPQALLAEERLQFKKLPRIGGGGNDAMNWPIMGRLVYPGAQMAETALGDAAKLSAPMFTAPGLFIAESMRAGDAAAKKKKKKTQEKETPHGS